MAKYLFLFAFISCSLFSCKTVAKILGIKPVHDTIILHHHNTITAFKYIDTANKTLKGWYADKSKIPLDSLNNTELYAFINRWWGTPYKWGGNDHNGVDCSSFIQWLFVEVYKIAIPRTTVQQLYSGSVELFRSAKYLSEGDIVFFRTIDNTVVSHVGVYLGNNRFVHCCTSEGVTISSLEELYYKRRYVAAGRIKAYGPNMRLAGVRGND